MSLLRRLWRDPRAAGAAEFALVLPLMLLFLLGIIDAGRYMWNINQAEKATQTGARWAVATDIIPGAGYDDGLAGYSFAVDGGVTQGTVVDSTAFPGVNCTADVDGNLSCSCPSSCDFETATDSGGQEAFDAMVARMQQIYPALDASDVSISYANSGLGYSGDPNGSDVDPIVTVSLTGMPFRPIFLGTIFDAGLPDLSYSLTMEDGQGSFAN